MARTKFSFTDPKTHKKSGFSVQFPKEQNVPVGGYPIKKLAVGNKKSRMSRRPQTA